MAITDYDIIVAGAGASGLLAAGRASSLGARVLLIEHQARPGRKLSITGKGRCNLTNTDELADFLRHFHPHGRFLRPSFSHFFSDRLMRLMESLGVKVVVERGGRVFPENGKAPEVAAALVNWVNTQGVQLKTNTAVEALISSNGVISGVIACPVTQRKNKVVKDKTSRQEIACKALILATGGASYPATGSTGDGYRLAQSVGHEIIAPRPALVPLETDEESVAELDGLMLKNIEVSLWSGGKKKAAAFGEMSFTPFGFSGPVVLTLSHQAVDLLREGKAVELTLDLKPALDHKKLDDRLLRDFVAHHHEPFHLILKGLLPRRLIPFCLKRLPVDGEKKGGELTAKDRKMIRIWLKEVRFSITGYRPFSEAIITSGGVKLQEVNPKTLESRKCQRLYIAGELLDIQADTGGYNLQAAFSTGYLAADSAVKSLTETC